MRTHGAAVLIYPDHRAPLLVMVTILPRKQRMAVRSRRGAPPRGRRAWRPCPSASRGHTNIAARSLPDARAQRGRATIVDLSAQHRHRPGCRLGDLARPGLYRRELGRCVLSVAVDDNRGAEGDDAA